MAKRGRPLGAKSKRPQGFKRAAKILEGIREAIHEGRLSLDDDPEAHEAYGTVLYIMRGQISGRHSGTRLSAALAILDRRLGRPKQTTEHELGATFTELIEKSMEVNTGRRLPSAKIPVLEGEVVGSDRPEVLPSSDPTAVQNRLFSHQRDAVPIPRLEPEVDHVPINIKEELAS